MVLKINPSTLDDLYCLVSINENYQFHHIRFDCIQGEQGELVFEPSDVEYYFEPVTIQESGTSILKNELENSEDGAGQVAFNSPMMVRMKSSMVKAITTLLDWPPESPDNQYHLNK